jgi:hypothetical protein
MFKRPTASRGTMIKNGALKLALEALEGIYHGDTRPVVQYKIIKSIREALAAPVQEPDCKETGVCVQTGLACFGQAAQPAPAQEPVARIAVLEAALNEIASAGMSPSPEMSDDGKTAWHASQAWRFIGIAARAIESAPAPVGERCCYHDSDCAVHNMPAYPAGPCDCTQQFKFFSVTGKYERQAFADLAGAEAYCKGLNTTYPEGTYIVRPLLEEAHYMRKTTALAAQPTQDLSRLKPFVHGLGQAILQELMTTPPAAQPAPVPKENT